jgi:hypothetical protein
MPGFSGRKVDKMSATWTVQNMRVIVPTGKVAERNPDRFATIHGTFFDPKGEKLSFSQKEVTLEMARNPETVIDVENGILTLPSNQRGRPISKGIEQNAISDMLNELRNEKTAK